MNRNGMTFCKYFHARFLGSERNESEILASSNLVFLEAGNSYSYDRNEHNGKILKYVTARYLRTNSRLFPMLAVDMTWFYGNRARAIRSFDESAYGHAIAARYGPVAALGALHRIDYAGGRWQSRPGLDALASTDLERHRLRMTQSKGVNHAIKQWPRLVSDRRVARVAQRSGFGG